MFVSNNIGIIADDLTGANDTALQFHEYGCNTQMILELNSEIVNKDLVQCWAISTESRNVPSFDAFDAVKEACSFMKNELNVEHFYKKIDSTLRGNIARETIAMLGVLEYDAAIIVPAFPDEGRITVGGYQLLNGVPVERTWLARDPMSPIYESHIPTLLKKQLGDEEKDIVGLLELQTIIKGAGPILMKLNELISAGKRLIVADSVCDMDLEQIILAVNKSNYNILPCGAAALAKGFSKSILPDTKYQFVQQNVPILPKLVISGSATKLTSSQIKYLENSDCFQNKYFVPLTTENIMRGVTEEMVDRVCENMGQSNIVTVYSSDIAVNPDLDKSDLFIQGITKERFVSMITTYLAELTKRVIAKSPAVLITLGGETSRKCCNAIGSKVLRIADAVETAMPLCVDNNGQWIVTKSGNLGHGDTLVKILKYFEAHQA